MATLKTDFEDGQFLTAGAITSTSSMNGITTTVNSNTITKLMYIASDVTESSHTGDTNITTLASFTIAPNTISTGIIVQATFKCQGDDSNSRGFLKIGATSSEAIKVEAVQGPRVTDSTNVNDFIPITYYDSTQNWAAEVTVLLQGQVAVGTDTIFLTSAIITGN